MLPDTRAARCRVGIGVGELAPLASDPELARVGPLGDLAWGPALTMANALAARAKIGEMLCAAEIVIAQGGALVASGARHARDGDARYRGLLVDPRSPWRSQGIEQLARMRVAPWVGDALERLSVRLGALSVVRADPGGGGTRFLSELAQRAPRALLISPSGAGLEPLGALRRALARSITRDLGPMLALQATELEKLLAGEGVTLESAARLVASFLASRTAGAPMGIVVIDDAKSVDPSTLAACVRAAEEHRFAIIVRLDATGSLPAVLASLPKEVELDLPPLTPPLAEELARRCTNDALDEEARARWARLGGGSPLGVVEAVTCGIAGGQMSWSGDRASPRSRSAGKGHLRPPSGWIARRAVQEPAPCRLVLGLVALLGGEAKTARIASILEAAGETFDVDAAIEELMRSRWLLDTQEDWVGLPSRTHRDALIGGLDDSTKKQLHSVIADVIEPEEGLFGTVEAAWHAAQAGDGARAARILLEVSKSAAAGQLEASTTQLIAFARRADPSCEEAALELLANALESSPRLPAPPVAPMAPMGTTTSVVLPPAPPSTRMPVAPPAPPNRRASSASLPPPAPPPLVAVATPATPAVAAVDAVDDSIAERAMIVAPGVLEAHLAAPDDSSPTLLEDERAPAIDETPSAMIPPAEENPPGSSIANRLSELAKEALLAADNAALEHWASGLRAAGESPAFTERMLAMARLGRGDIGDALRVLRRARASLDPKELALRCQTSLALGVALNVAGRPQEALLEGLDALARARQVRDEQGAKACLAFLAKLYASQALSLEANKLRAESVPPPPAR